MNWNEMKVCNLLITWELGWYNAWIIHCLFSNLQYCLEGKVFMLTRLADLVYVLFAKHPSPQLLSFMKNSLIWEWCDAQKENMHLHIVTLDIILNSSLDLNFHGGYSIYKIWNQIKHIPILYKISCKVPRHIENLKWFHYRALYHDYMLQSKSLPFNIHAWACSGRFRQFIYIFSVQRCTVHISGLLLNMHSHACISEWVVSGDQGSLHHFAG